MFRWAGLLVALLLAGCVVSEVPLDELFPAQVGDFFRISGPSPEPPAGADTASYQGPHGTATLRIKWVGAEQVEHALSELPASASEIGYDPALGQRQGSFFDFADEYHAAWGNGDWVFVLSASTPEARVAFLAAYGF